MLKLIDAVDLFVYDCSLKDKEYPDFAGFGHSTYEEALRLQNIADARALAAIHHMPFRGDSELDEIEKQLMEQNDHNLVARERYCIKL